MRPEQDQTIVKKGALQRNTSNKGVGVITVRISGSAFYAPAHSTHCASAESKTDSERGS